MRAFFSKTGAAIAAITGLGSHTSSAAILGTSEGQKFQIETLTQQEDVVWGFDFIDPKQIIFTERDGALRTLDLQSKKVTSISGAPRVWANGQGGLLDVRVSGSQVFLTYAEPVEKSKATTAMGFGSLKNGALVGFKKVFSGNAPSDQQIHFGSRIEFDGQGHVFVTVGDRNDRKKVLDLAFHNGKVLRFKLDGSIPSDNPFVTNKSALPEIWTSGHRSPQGLFYDSKSNSLWLTEMGPKGGDELNLIAKGENYGWPLATYGREYYGLSIGSKAVAGTTQPVAHWVPSISPSGSMIYQGSAFKGWVDNIFIGCLSGLHIRRLVLKDKKVIKEENLLEGENLRIRNIRSGPDGLIYFSTDSGMIARFKPAQQ